MPRSPAESPKRSASEDTAGLSDSDEVFEQVDRLATEFLDRLRKGERPTIAEYSSRYPELAHSIREMFPALVMVERLKPDSDETIGLSDSQGARGRHWSDDRPPDRLGDYRILREIGRGGMGIVYEAEQESLGRRVALKRLAPWATAREDHLIRFHREARSAAQLHHTNIVPVFGVGVDQGRHFYTMQFIHGAGLHQILDELLRLNLFDSADSKAPASSIAEPSDETIAGEIARSLRLDRSWAAAPEAPLSPPFGSLPSKRSPAFRSEAETSESPTARMVATATRDDGQFPRSIARVGLQVAEALSHAHEQGTLHRDIKPANILIDAVGNAWITDFGLAKTIDDEDLTRTGDLVGTIRYMAPERFRGVCDPRSDVYSLGLTLYELLARRPAFVESDRHVLMHKVIQDDPPRLESLVNGIPRDLATVIHKAIEKDPNDRYRSASRLAADLRRFLDDRPIEARRISPVERIARWGKRNPGLMGLLATVALLLVIVAVVSTVSAFRLREGQAEIKRRLWEAYVAQARASRRSGAEGQRFDSLNSLTEASLLRTFAERRDELRDEAIACFPLADLRRIDARILPELSTRSDQLAFSPDGERLAIGDREGVVRILSAEETETREIMILPGPSLPAIPLRFSPDGHRLAVKYDDNWQASFLRVFDLRDGSMLLDEPAAVHASAVGFDPTGRWLAAGHQDGRIRLHDLEGIFSPIDLPGVPEPFAVAYSPDGTRIAVSSLKSEKSVLLVDPKAKAISARWDLRHGARSLGWSPDGARLAVGGGFREIWLIDPDRPDVTPMHLPGHKGSVVTVAFSHRGHLLASASWDGTVRLWHPESGEQRVVALSPDHWTVQFSPDDRTLSGGREGAICWRWEVADGDEARSRHDTFDPDTRTWTINHVPDEPILVSAGSFGLRLLGENLRVIGEAATDGLESATVLPDGQAILTGGASGLSRWPIERNEGQILLGSPEPFGPIVGLKTGRIRMNAEGTRLAAVFASPWPEAVVFESDGSGTPVVIRDHPGLERIDLSPDGRRLATGTWRGTGVKVWDTTTGALLADLPVEGSAEVDFSPDGLWLLTGSGPEYQCWNTLNWSLHWSIPRREASNLPGKIAFSSDGSLVAVAWTRTLVRLVSPHSGAILATLEAPNPDHIAELGLNADGSLLFVTDHGGCIRRWDLLAVRNRLATLGIGWPELDRNRSNNGEPEAVDHR